MALATSIARQRRAELEAVSIVDRAAVAMGSADCEAGSIVAVDAAAAKVGEWRVDENAVERDE